VPPTEAALFGLPATTGDPLRAPATPQLLTLELELAGQRYR
jgi:hypothetical protein